LDSAGSKLIAVSVENVESVVMSSRSKHLSDNFETRRVFNVVDEKLSIEQSFHDVNDDDDVNMEIAFPETDLNVQFIIVLRVA